MKAVRVIADAKLSWDDMPTPAPAAGEVLIKVQATAINRADLMQRMGLYPPPPGASDVMGLECAGTIAAVGDGVTRWKKAMKYVRCSVVEVTHSLPSLQREACCPCHRV
jgi:NADPH:quinone reductase-like Zn-dependent oxidoreductase